MQVGIRSATNLEYMAAPQLVHWGGDGAVSMQAHTQLALSPPAPCENHTALRALLRRNPQHHTQQTKL